MTVENGKYALYFKIERAVPILPRHPERVAREDPPPHGADNYPYFKALRARRVKRTVRWTVRSQSGGHSRKCPQMTFLLLFSSPEKSSITKRYSFRNTYNLKS